MNSKYKISIIVPHYNSPDLLDKLLSTIPKRKEIQTIIIDDHSNEKTKGRIQEMQSQYSGTNFSFINNDTLDHNAGATRNIGLDHAEGEWLLFADADDYFLDGFYESIEKYLDLNYDVICFRPISIRLDTGEPDTRNETMCRVVEDYLQNPCSETEARLRYSWYVPWSRLVRKSIVQENGIRFDSIKYSNDEMFSAKIGFYATKITAFADKFYCVTRHEGSLTGNTNIETFDIRTREKINVFRFMKEHLTKDELRFICAYRISITLLRTILQRKYGIRCFFRYLNLFRKNGMLIFDIRILNPNRIIQGIRNHYTSRSTMTKREKKL